MVLNYLVLVLLIVCGNVPASSSADTCLQYADIVFLVDTSSDIADEDYPLELKFVKDLIDQFDVSWSTTRVGAISYSENDKLKFGLDHFRFAELIKTAVDHITFTKSNKRDSCGAIKLAHDLLSNHTRSWAARVIVYLTVGDPTEVDAALESAQKVRADGTLLFTVGVGADVDKEVLGKLATKNNAKFVHTAGDFNQLFTLAIPLAEQICSLTPAATTLFPPMTTTKPDIIEPTTAEPTPAAEPTTAEPTPAAEPTTTAEPTTMNPICDC